MVNKFLYVLGQGTYRTSCSYIVYFTLLELTLAAYIACPILDTFYIRTNYAFPTRAHIMEQIVNEILSIFHIIQKEIKVIKHIFTQIFIQFCFTYDLIIISISFLPQNIKEVGSI